LYACVLWCCGRIELFRRIDSRWMDRIQWSFVFHILPTQTFILGFHTMLWCLSSSAYSINYWRPFLWGLACLPFLFPSLFDSLLLLTSSGFHSHFHFHAHSYNSTTLTLALFLILLRSPSTLPFAHLCHTSSPFTHPHLSYRTPFFGLICSEVYLFFVSTFLSSPLMMLALPLVFSFFTFFLVTITATYYYRSCWWIHSPISARAFHAHTYAMIYAHYSRISMAVIDQYWHRNIT